METLENNVEVLCDAELEEVAGGLTAVEYELIKNMFNGSPVIPSTRV